MSKCCVVSCASKRKENHLHMFPKSEIGLQTWLQCINCDRLRSLSLQDLRKQYVCRRHFEKRFLASNRVRARLRIGAYPTLFTNSEISSGVPHTASIAIPNVSIEHDHVYRKRLVDDHNYCMTEVAKKKPRIEKELSTPHGINEIETAYVERNEGRKGRGTESSDIILNTDVLSTPSFRTRRKKYNQWKNKLSPHCEKLMKYYKKSRRQLNFTRRAKKALRFSKSKSFRKLAENLNPVTRKFIWMQIRECTKNTRGRRFSNDEKLIAMSILKQSPKCYRFLQKLFILPSRHTINKLISNLDVEAGINWKIFEAIKEEVKNWKPIQKYCCLLFDEVALEPALVYDKHKDKIDGFVEVQEKSNEFADHALVFMIRGINKNWQQPLAYYFCKGATAGVELKIIIEEIVTALGNTGLIPLALVCDQGTSFQSALKSLQEKTMREHSDDRIDDVIKIGTNTLSIIYDPPHLIKGIRNNFLTKNIKYQNKICKWSDIVEVYKTDCSHAQMRLLHKLNDQHVIPEKIKKMKVKNCTQVLSKTVAATLSYSAQFSHYADGKPISDTLKNTSEMVSFFDDLFDSVNGTAIRGSRGKMLRRAVTDKSAHAQFWREAIKKLKEIRFIDANNKEKSVPSQKNWITTIKSYQRVWHYLKKKNIRYLRPRFLNSDPIENFFGQVRAYNFRNNNPDCHTFKSTFKTLLITRFIKFHSDSYNCEEDSGEQLLKFKSLFNENSNPEVYEDNEESSPESSQIQTFVNVTATQNERLNVHSRAYTAGWVISKIMKNIKCKTCEETLTSNEMSIDKNSINNWVSIREYNSVKKMKLTYPSEKAVRLFGDVIKEVNIFLENTPEKNYIIQRIKTNIKEKHAINLINCQHHKTIVIESFLDVTCKLAVFNWCNIINKIVKGIDVTRLENKIMGLPKMQAKAYKIYKTKLKNKRIKK